MPPRFVRQTVANNTAQSLVQPSSSALISAFALRTLTSNKHIPFISTPAQAFVSGVGVPPNRIHQADNLAKLRQEFLSVTELIAKIFGAVSRTISLMRLSALLTCKRCRCHNDGFCSCYLARFRCNSRIPSTLSQISFRLQCTQSTSTLSRMWFKASRTSDERSEIA